MYVDWYAFDHIDVICFLGSLGILVVYHIYLNLQLRNNPRYTIQSVNNAARTAWVEHIMATPNKDILAVQTLRNSTMAATFLASTAVLLIIGVLNISQSGAGTGIIHSLAARQASYEVYLLKLSLLLFDLFVAFFAFSLAIRMYNHVGYLINSGIQAAGPTDPGYVARLLNRGGTYYGLGMRSYYLSVPCVFWLFGPLFMLAASVVLVIALYHIDRSPDITIGTSRADSHLGISDMWRFIHSKTA